MSILKVNELQSRTSGNRITLPDVNNYPPYRNLIINGDMSIAQRGTSVSSVTSDGYRTCDRWRLQITTAGTWTVSQSTDVPTGQGFGKSFKLDCTTADTSLGASDGIRLETRLEGQNLQQLKKGTSNAESTTLSFWVKSNKTGTYPVTLRDIDNSRLISKTYTISSADTWEKKTLTYDGDTTGSLNNDNGESLRFEFWLGAGTNFTSGTAQTTWGTSADNLRASGLTVNLADSTSNYINITGVQLEVGDSATPFEHIPYDISLARCQRYYLKMTKVGGDYPFASGYQYGSTGVTAFFPYPVTFRATGSVTILGTIYSKSYGTNSVSISSIGLIGDWYNQFKTLNGTTSSTHSGGHPCVITNGGGGESGIAIDCEL